MQPKNNHILHSGINNRIIRNWQGINCGITSSNLMYPVFIIENDNSKQEIQSMPGVARYGINQLKAHLEPLILKGLESILVFGVTENLPKDAEGFHANSIDNPVIRALPQLRKWFPDLIIACDVCLCPYTDHGHCGILNSDETVNNAKSLQRISEISLSYAIAGAHIVAPSDMMDGRIGAIKEILIKHQLAHRVSVLSYTAKFASSFYGPFRDAAKSKPAFGDRKCYQLPIGSEGLARRAAARDVEEGADMLMVKPGLAYLDIAKQIKTSYPDYPLFMYQVSGEYAMIYHGAKEGAFELKSMLQEVLTSMRRAGADVIITYFVPTILNWLSVNNKY